MAAAQSQCSMFVFSQIKMSLCGSLPRINVVSRHSTQDQSFTSWPLPKIIVYVCSASDQSVTLWPSTKNHRSICALSIGSNFPAIDLYLRSVQYLCIQPRIKALSHDPLPRISVVCLLCFRSNYHYMPLYLESMQYLCTQFKSLVLYICALYLLVNFFYAVQVAEL